MNLRRTPEAQPLALKGEACPRLSDTVAIEESPADGQLAIIAVSGVPASRASPDLARLLRAMDGCTSVTALKANFAAEQTEDEFQALMERFWNAGLLAGGERPVAGRVTFRPPLTLQFATLRAPALFTAAHRVTRLLVRRETAVAAVGMLLIGLIALIAQWNQVLHVVRSPVPLVGLVIVACALTAATLVHELAHGATLTRFGEVPRRAGFMLLYLSPAFFVDVTNGWRLPRRRDRVAVALAGPAVHAMLAGGSLVAAWGVATWFADAPEAHTTLVLLGIAALAIVAVNLIPFVRFDGYLALMSWLDEPGLRARTMHDARESMRRVLFGGEAKPRQFPRWWSVPFGLFSYAAPTALVVYALWRILYALAAGGAVTTVLVFVIEGTLALVALAFIGRMLRNAWRSGAHPVRIVLVMAALGASLLGLGAGLRVPVVAQAGFVAENGQIQLVAAEPPSRLWSEGMPVELVTNGLMASPVVGTATLRPAPVHARQAPFEALFPLSVEMTLPAYGFATAVLDPSSAEARVPDAGSARIIVGSESLWELVWRNLVLDPARILAGTGE